MAQLKVPFKHRLIRDQGRAESATEGLGVSDNNKTYYLWNSK